MKLQKILVLAISIMSATHQIKECKARLSGDDENSFAHTIADAMIG